MKIELVFKRGLCTVARVEGKIEVEKLSTKEEEQVIATEQFLEKLTGVRVHIQEYIQK